MDETVWPLAAAVALAVTIAAIGWVAAYVVAVGIYDGATFAVESAGTLADAAWGVAINVVTFPGW